MTVTPIHTLRAQAEAQAEAFPGLLARAERLVASMAFGDHGRRRGGAGDAFWQFRPAELGDDAKTIDWRRSARGDDPFVRQTEWQLAQTVLFWVDPAQSMQFATTGSVKYDRAALVTLSLCILLARGGERFGFAGTDRSGADIPGAGMAGADLTGGTGQAQLDRVEAALSLPLSTQSGPVDDFGTPDLSGLRPGGQVALLSDFLGDLDPVAQAVRLAASRGVGGAMCMILDPSEVDFPFRGRTRFESMSGALRYDSRRAQSLGQEYKDALAHRQNALAGLARAAGWRFLVHQTDHPAQQIVAQMYQALGGAIR